MHNAPLSFLIYLLYFKNSKLLNRCKLGPCVYDVFDSESALELNSEVVTLTPGTTYIYIYIYIYIWYIIEQRSWESNLSNQPDTHWNVNTIGTQSPICFDTSSVPSCTIRAILKKRWGWWVYTFLNTSNPGGTFRDLLSPMERTPVEMLAESERTCMCVALTFFFHKR